MNLSEFHNYKNLSSHAIYSVGFILVYQYIVCEAGKKEL